MRRRSESWPDDTRGSPVSLRELVNGALDSDALADTGSCGHISALGSSRDQSSFARVTVLRGPRGGRSVKPSIGLNAFGAEHSVWG
jgi:hypothetical protein